MVAGEGHPLSGQPIDGRREVGTDLRRLEPVEGSDQDTQAGAAAAPTWSAA
jgi:hypothetical protein